MFRTVCVLCIEPLNCCFLPAFFVVPSCLANGPQPSRQQPHCTAFSMHTTLMYAHFPFPDCVALAGWLAAHLLVDFED